MGKGNTSGEGKFPWRPSLCKEQRSHHPTRGPIHSTPEQTGGCQQLGQRQNQNATWHQQDVKAIGAIVIRLCPATPLPMLKGAAPPQPATPGHRWSARHTVLQQRCVAFIPEDLCRQLFLYSRAQPSQALDSRHQRKKCLFSTGFTAALSRMGKTGLKWLLFASCVGTMAASAPRPEGFAPLC